MLLLQHTRCRDNALRVFNSSRKMGGPEFSKSYYDRLELEISELYDTFIKHNESKNIFAAAKTPAVLFSVIVMFYFVSGIFAISWITIVSECVESVHACRTLPSGCLGIYTIHRGASRYGGACRRPCLHTLGERKLLFISYSETSVDLQLISHFNCV